MNGTAVAIERVSLEEATMKRFATTFIALIILPLAARAEVLEATLANDLMLLRSALVDGDHDVNAAGMASLGADLKNPHKMFGVFPDWLANFMEKPRAK